jgi:hypothetical protein
MAEQLCVGGPYSFEPIQFGLLRLVGDKLLICSHLQLPRNSWHGISSLDEKLKRNYHTDFMKKIVGGLLIALVVVAANATQVTVQELTTSPAQTPSVKITNPDGTLFYQGGVYAGIAKLLVDGKPTDGFCIDPYHFSSSSPLLYDVIPLENAPKSPGTFPTGSDKANLIRVLWAQNYAPSMTADQAAGLQIAIWEVVGGDNFTVTSGNLFGSNIMLANAQTALASGAQGADLVALSGAGQDYVVRNIPDAGTSLTLLSLAFVGLVVVRRKFGSLENSSIS